MRISIETRVFLIGVALFAFYMLLPAGADRWWMVTSSRASLLTVVLVFGFFRLLGARTKSVVARMIAPLLILGAVQFAASELFSAGSGDGDLDLFQVLGVSYLFLSFFLFYRFMIFAKSVLEEREPSWVGSIFLLGLLIQSWRWLGYMTLGVSLVFILVGLVYGEEDTSVYLVGFLAVVLLSPPLFRLVFGLDYHKSEVYDKARGLMFLFFVLVSFSALLHSVSEYTANQGFSQVRLYILSLVAVSFVFHLEDASWMKSLSERGRSKEDRYDHTDTVQAHSVDEEQEKEREEKEKVKMERKSPPKRRNMR